MRLSKHALRDARQTQHDLRERIILRDDFGPIRYVAGADVGFEKHGEIARGAVAVLSWPTLDIVDTAIARARVTFPYIPGYLSFREVPVLLKAFANLTTPIDLIICDGQGFAHPRRFGLACHLGLALDKPALGAAKSRLIGEHADPARKRGSYRRLIDHGEHIGYVLRSRDNTRPLYVSPGHRIGMTSARRFTLGACPRYRIPETTRAAHQLASGPTIDNNDTNTQ